MKGKEEGKRIESDLVWKGFFSRDCREKSS